LIHANQVKQYSTTTRMQFHLKTSTGELHVVKYGNYAERPTIVFLHESLGSVELWRDFPKKLEELTKSNVLVYDRQGHGKSSSFMTLERDNDYLESEADILLEVLNAYGIDDTILFGHSDGGSIALIAAAKHPSKIIGIISEAAHIFVEEITLEGIRGAVKAYPTTSLKQKLQKYHGEKTDELFWSWAKTWLSEEFRSWNIESFLPHIKCPVLVIQGERDEYGSEEQVNGIINQVSGEAQKIIIPIVGHTPHREAAEVVLKCSASFINHLIEKP
jgi:pimeloyl-ACP methyl ester carboxylesterase